VTTRAFFYERRFGGGYRTARAPKTCEQSLCLRKIQPGEKFFDTNEVTTWPRKKVICAICAEEHV
jgi:hypothetical protein